MTQSFYANIQETPLNGKFLYVRGEGGMERHRDGLTALVRAVATTRGVAPRGRRLRCHRAAAARACPKLVQCRPDIGILPGWTDRRRRARAPLSVQRPSPLPKRSAALAPPRSSDSDRTEKFENRVSADRKSTRLNSSH